MSAPTLVDHTVKIAPVWAPDKHTSRLLGTRARRIVGWHAACTQCDWELGCVTWSDARRFGHNHRRIASRVARA